MEIRPTANPVGIMGKRLGTNSGTIFKGYDKMSTGVWIGKLSNEIWKITEDLWTLRNEAEHKDDKSRVNQERNTKVNADIDDIYNKLPKNLRILPHDDMQFFSKKKFIQKTKAI